MSTAEILVLGVIAGGPIFLGLPMGRVQNLSMAARAGLSAFATGILIFLLWDVLSGAVEPIEDAVGESDWAQFAGFAALGLAGFLLGYLTLVSYTEWVKRRAQGRRTNLVGPGAPAIDEFDDRRWLERLTPG